MKTSISTERLAQQLENVSKLSKTTCLLYARYYNDNENEKNSMAILPIKLTKFKYYKYFFDSSGDFDPQLDLKHSTQITN